MNIHVCKGRACLDYQERPTEKPVTNENLFATTSFKLLGPFGERDQNLISVTTYNCNILVSVVETCT